MSFNLFRVSDQKNLQDLRINYKQTAYDFCTQYYTNYDHYLTDLMPFFTQETQFTYQNTEFTGFNNFLLKLKGDNVTKFAHQDMNITVQPIGPGQMIIIVLGLITINSAVFPSKFIETLLLQRNEFNKLQIISTIFKLID